MITIFSLKYVSSGEFAKVIYQLPNFKILFILKEKVLFSSTALKDNDSI